MMDGHAEFMKRYDPAVIAAKRRVKVHLATDGDGYGRPFAGCIGRDDVVLTNDENKVTCKWCLAKINRFRTMLDRLGRLTGRIAVAE